MVFKFIPVHEDAKQYTFKISIEHEPIFDVIARLYIQFNLLNP